ncbi:MAG: ECF transporter S component [Clostridia bacterium]|nr:ECF transporter S component [Clostridia bacterium]
MKYQFKRIANTRAFAILALLTALLMVFSFTPIGTIPIGPLSITLNIIPVAIAAIALGPVGGLIIGCVFGILSYLQCISIGVPSGMGAILFSINPFLAFIQRFVPRALDGFLVGLIYDAIKKRTATRGGVSVSTALFGLIAGVILAAIGAFVIVAGVNKNNSAAAQTASLITEGHTNPGTIYIVIGAVLAAIGTIAFIVSLIDSRKNKRIEVMPECFVAGFLSAFLNTLFFMTALVGLFGHTEYIQNLMAGRNIFVFIIAFVGINALVEIIVSTLITGLVGTALHRAKVLPLKTKN